MLKALQTPFVPIYDVPLSDSRRCIPIHGAAFRFYCRIPIYDAAFRLTARRIPIYASFRLTARRIPIDGAPHSD
jgi:hypothetical protein